MKLLFICTANVCRSPLAEGYLASLLKKKNHSGIGVASAGVLALPGSAAFECAIETARNFGFDLSQHCARQFTVEMGRQADQILCMETWQASEVLNMDPQFVDKVRLLGAYHPSAQRLFQINDPRAFTLVETLKTFELIRASVDSIVAQLA